MDSVRTDPTTGSDAVPVIDAGLREWYESCPCCMSKAMPEVKQALDREHALRPEPATTESTAG